MSARALWLLSIGLLLAGCSESRRPGSGVTPVRGDARAADGATGGDGAASGDDGAADGGTSPVEDAREGVDAVVGADAPDSTPDSGSDTPETGGSDDATVAPPSDSGAGSPDADGSVFDAGIGDANVGPDASSSADGGLNPNALLRVSVGWDTNGTDLDLHLVRNGGAPFTMPDDCYYANLTPDWGQSGVAVDDCRFELDDLDGFGPEVVAIDAPAAGTYDVYVHYYDGTPLTAASVEVVMNGVVSTTSQTMLDCDALWRAGTITWNGTSGTFAPGTTVTVDTHGQCFP